MSIPLRLIHGALSADFLGLVKVDFALVPGQRNYPAGVMGGIDPAMRPRGRGGPTERQGFAGACMTTG